MKQIQIKKINVYPGISSIEIEEYNKNNQEKMKQNQKRKTKK